MIKTVLGLVACAGLALGGFFIYSGAIDGNASGGSCCHKPDSSVAVKAESCSASEDMSGCCASPSRNLAISLSGKTACCEAVEGAVEVLTVLPREVAAK